MTTTAHPILEHKRADDRVVQIFVDQAKTGKWAYSLFLSPALGQSVSDVPGFETRQAAIDAAIADADALRLDD